MYDKLVKRLRDHAVCADSGNEIGNSMYLDILKATDAIEELSKVVDAIPHVCECCIGCEVESGGCDIAFVLSPKRAMEYLSKPRWVSVTERLPEESEGLDFHEDMMIRFTSVWCCDANTGTINVRNRYQHKITGIQFLDQNIQDTEWHWSTSWWEPTHWMPIVTLPAPTKEEAL